ncbi:MAG: ATP-binding cassette domain-containing protein [Proteobacteria bacterium]|nr:ATP-binding cassette domain-containing protein [Pseudomonadota bacterium]
MRISDGQQQPPPLLEFKDVDTYYGELHVLKSVNCRVGEGEIVCLLGGNASGKSTTMKTILGIVAAQRGTITYGGEVINNLPTAERVRRGIAPVPEARRLFPRMTVLENLEMGAFTRVDEPSMGLSPLYVEQVFEIVQTINRQGTTIFMVEQNANMALSIATYGYVLQTGEVVLSGTAKSLRDNEMIRQAYLGEMKTR